MKSKQQGELFPNSKWDKRSDVIVLDRDEIEVLVEEPTRVVLYDKIVDRIYTWTMSPDPIWHFPVGSRKAMIEKLTGFKP